MKRFLIATLLSVLSISVFWTIMGWPSNMFDQVFLLISVLFFIPALAVFSLLIGRNVSGGKFGSLGFRIVASTIILISAFLGFIIYVFTRSAP